MSVLRGGLVWSLVSVLGLALVAIAAAWIMDVRLATVDTASMAPTVRAGALGVLSPTAPSQVREGDVIAFRVPGADQRVLHRVVAVLHRPNGLAFVTKGDANPTPDQVVIPQELVEGQLSLAIPRLGRVVTAARPPWGLVAFGAVPAVHVVFARLARHRRPALRTA